MNEKLSKILLYIAIFVTVACFLWYISGGTMPVKVVEPSAIQTTVQQRVAQPTQQSIQVCLVSKDGVSTCTDTSYQKAIDNYNNDENLKP